MYQQNQNSYQQQQQQSQQQVHLQEQDFANFVLSELKRSAREYTTAALEAANPQIRQTFQTLLLKTLQDQAAVFNELQKLGAYEVQPAQQQQIQQELQKQSQTAAQLQTFVQQNLNRSTTASYQQQDQMAIGQQHAQHQQQPQHQPQSQQQNQIAALHQAPIQPMINASQYPNAVYNSQGQGFASHQQPSYTNQQGQSYQDQSYGQSSYGQSQAGYSASSAFGSTESTPITSKTANTSITSRAQTGMLAPSSSAASESSYISKHHEGSKYSF
ncbi:spore coat protein [Paenibacillus alba]|uniref:spore coat protein n=1 Tax=Paenibacillus alba TaxID=1197127 RepID=UPI0015631CF6|nr:spore coat protein [Paenibacillus alba]NQX70057.1 spore coat protein [Paenibacillus alba]